MTESYLPISCSLHDEYEITIMHKKHINIEWSDNAGVQYTGKILPKEILVKNKQEFLVANTEDGNELCIRLDRITLLDD